MPPALPDAAEIAALRAWCSGLSSTAAAARYLPPRPGTNARGRLSRLRDDLVALARERRRPDLVEYFARLPRVPRAQRLRLDECLERLRAAPIPRPAPSDRVDEWLPARAAAALRAAGIDTLGQAAARIAQRRRWWRDVAGLGPAGARAVEGFVSGHDTLAQAGRQLAAAAAGVPELLPWERLRAPRELDGSRGTLRAPARSCVLSAANDHQALGAWLSLQESDATRRAYRKEAERLMLWAIVERAKPLSSLTTEDAIAYRAFLRDPAPRARWVGPPAARGSAAWRPFTGPLSPRSAAYALSVLGAMYRWLVEQRYLLANPFAGVKVRSALRTGAVDASRAFGPDEWALIRPLADMLRTADGWSPAAQARLAFVLDFAYGTGLRAGELVAATLGDVRTDEAARRWIAVVGKGSKAGLVAVPPLAALALDRYLAARRLPLQPQHWEPATPLLARVDDEPGGLTAGRLWAVLKRFFSQAAAALDPVSPRAAQKLRSASTHWMRHTHATHALAAGAALTTVRDNLRHASVSTTSTYLHTDEAVRARQLAAAFGLPGREAKPAA